MPWGCSTLPASSGQRASLVRICRDALADESSPVQHNFVWSDVYIDPETWQPLQARHLLTTAISQGRRYFRGEPTYIPAHKKERLIFRLQFTAGRLLLEVANIASNHDRDVNVNVDRRALPPLPQLGSLQEETQALIMRVHRLDYTSSTCFFGLQF